MIQQRNFLEVFVYEQWSGTLLPEFTEGETFTPTELSMKEGETTAPKLLTEADLVSLMDRNGIGEWPASGDGAGADGRAWQAPMRRLQSTSQRSSSARTS